jgi:hypothetical protein
MTERELLKEAQDLMATVVLHAAINADIKPDTATARRILKWNDAVRALGGNP